MQASGIMGVITNTNTNTDNRELQLALKYIFQPSSFVFSKFGKEY